MPANYNETTKTVFNNRTMSAHVSLRQKRSTGGAMYKKNRIKEMIDNGQVPLGMQCFTEDPALIEIMALTGFDYVMLDSEHSGNDPRAMEPLIRAADSVGVNRCRCRCVSHCLPGNGGRTGALEKGVRGTKFTRPEKKNWSFAPLRNPQAFLGREKWPEPLNFFEVETFSRLKPKQSNTERN
jgi:hypothetical protein